MQAIEAYVLRTFIAGYKNKFGDNAIIYPLHDCVIIPASNILESQLLFNDINFDLMLNIGSYLKKMFINDENLTRFGVSKLNQVSAEIDKYLATTHTTPMYTPSYDEQTPRSLLSPRNF